MPMSDPRELEWAKEPNALKESWKARIRTHIIHGVPLTVALLLMSKRRQTGVNEWRERKERRG